MAIGGAHRHLMADDDAVKPGNGARGMKAFGRLHQPVMVKGKLAQRAFVRPLVKVTHHDRRHKSGAGINGSEQGADLLAPP